VTLAVVVPSLAFSSTNKPKSAFASTRLLDRTSAGLPPK